MHAHCPLSVWHGMVVSYESNTLLAQWLRASFYSFPKSALTQSWRPAEWDGAGVCPSLTRHLKILEEVVTLIDLTFSLRSPLSLHPLAYWAQLRGCCVRNLQWTCHAWLRPAAQACRPRPHGRNSEVGSLSWEAEEPNEPAKTRRCRKILQQSAQQSTPCRNFPRHPARKRVVWGDGTLARGTHHIFPAAERSPPCLIVPLGIAAPMSCWVFESIAVGCHLNLAKECFGMESAMS